MKQMIRVRLKADGVYAFIIVSDVINPRNVTLDASVVSLVVLKRLTFCPEVKSEVFFISLFFFLFYFFLKK